MKCLKLKKQLAVLAIIVFAFSACKKVEITKPIGETEPMGVEIAENTDDTEQSLIGSNLIGRLNDDNFNEYKDAILIQNKVHQYFNNDMINYIPYGYMTQNKVYNISEILAGGNFGAGVNNHQERVSVVKRFCVNKQKLMEDVLRKLMKMGTDLNSLTEVYFSGDSNMRYPSVNFNKLEEVCFVLFTEAKNNLASMKKHIPREIIKKYEDLKINIAGVNVDNQMSLFYLQENLFERLF